MEPKDAYTLKKVEKIEGENYPNVPKETEKPKYLGLTLSNGLEDLQLNLFEGDAKDMAARMVKCLI